MQERMYKDKLNYSSFNLSLNTSKSSIKGKGEHIQTHIFLKFDLSLIKNQYSAKKKQCRSACTKTNSIIQVKLELQYN